MAKAKITDGPTSGQPPRSGTIRAEGDPAPPVTIPNATTRKTLLEAEEGQNLHRHGGVDEMLKKLGV